MDNWKYCYMRHSSINCLKREKDNSFCINSSEINRKLIGNLKKNLYLYFVLLFLCLAEISRHYFETLKLFIKWTEIRLCSVNRGERMTRKVVIYY